DNILITDLRGNTISIPKDPKRIVVLAPDLVEIFYYLNLEDLIVGRVIEADYPEEVSNIQIVGHFQRPDIEKIIKLNPDLVISTGLVQEKTTEKLMQLGIPVLELYINSFEEMFSVFDILGTITNTSNNTNLKKDNLKQRLNSIRLNQMKKSLKVLAIIWWDPLMVVGRDTILDSVLKEMNFKNIASGYISGYSKINIEVILQENPDILLFVGVNNIDEIMNELKRSEIWSQVNAVKKEKIVVDINPDLLLRASPRLLDGMEELNRRLE
ncbi:MAG: helical backbone metal receptor, partial [bacterium]|nr:helical backbone metal receptor [bacterium]